MANGSYPRYPGSEGSGSRQSRGGSDGWQDQDPTRGSMRAGEYRSGRGDESSEQGRHDQDQRERWRDEWGAGRHDEGRGPVRSGGGSSFEQQSSPRYRGGGQGRYDPNDMGGARNPYSSGYAGYDPSGGGVERYGMYGVRETGRDDDWESGQTYGSQRAGGYGRQQGAQGANERTWREMEERDRLRQRSGEAGYGGGYYGSSRGGGQSYSGAQRAYPGDPGYRQSGPQGGNRGYGLESYEAGGYGGRPGGGSPGQSWQRPWGGGQGGGGQGPQRRRRVGPKGYQRSDERIHEDLCERLSDVPMVDVSEVEVNVSDGVVTLTGTVRERHEKFVIEDIADEIFGVKEVHNQIRVTRGMGSAGTGSGAGGDYGATSGSTGGLGQGGSAGTAGGMSTGSSAGSSAGTSGGMGTAGSATSFGGTSSISSASGSTPDIGDGLGSTGKDPNRR